MCDKIEYGTFRIDPCLEKKIEMINSISGVKTLASCCGHGKYSPSIIIKNDFGIVFDFYTLKEIPEKKRNRYYRKDNQGFYYIPELINGSSKKH